MPLGSTKQQAPSTRVISLATEGVYNSGGKVHFPSSRCFELLVFLASNANRDIARPDLAELIWGQSNPSAKHSLSNALYTVRRLIPQIPLTSSRLHVRFSDENIYYDVWRLNEYLDVADCKGVFETYTQPFLATYAGTASEYFLEWAEEYRRSLHERVRHVLVAQFKHLERGGLWEASAQLAKDLNRLGIKDEAIESTSDRARSSHARIELSEHVPELYARGLMLSRETELRALQQNYLRALNAGPSFALITGDPGIGKSHLCKHFLRLAAVKGSRILHARASRPDRRHSYSVFLRALNAGSNAKVRERLMTLAPLLSEMTHDRSCAKTGNIQRSVDDTIVEALERLASEGPITIFIDDYQWCDSASRNLCERLIEDLQGAPIQIVLTSRTALKDPFARLRAPQFSAKKSEIHLTGLPEEDAVRLAMETALLHGFSLERNAARDLYRRLGGNPFYMIETVASFATEPTNDPISAAVPHSVQAYTVSRIKQLPPGDQALLLRLAVAGRPESSATLKKLLPHQTRFSVSRLVALGLVSLNEERIAFSHDLLSEAVYHKTPIRIRRSLHRKYAELLISSGASAAEVFWHLKQSGDDAKAARYARMAAEQADSIEAYRDAEYFFRLAVEYAETHDLKTTALQRLALFYMRARQPHAAEAVWKNLADTTHDEERSRAYLAWRIATLASANQSAAADISIVIVEIEQLITIARESGFRESFVPAIYLLGELALDLERTDLLETVLSAVAEYSKTVADPDIAEELALLEAQLLSYGGHQKRALQLIQKHEPGTARPMASKARWLAAKAVLLMNMGRAPESVKCYEEVANLTKEANPEFWEGLINNYGLVLWECGRYDEAKQLWMQKLSDPRSRSVARQVYIHVNLSFLTYDLGQHEVALSHARSALSKNASRGSRSVIANASAVIGLCAMANQNEEEMNEAFETVLASIPEVACGFSDSTYPEVFIARYLNRNERHRALERLEKAIAWYAARSASSFHTLRLERARIYYEDDPEYTMREVLDVETWAIKSGALAIADQAQLCRRTLHNPRSLNSRDLE